MRSWYRIALAAVVTTAAGPRSTAAQTGTITGTVIEKGSSKPIDAVTISIKGVSFSTRTKANGQYVILGVPPGSYTVVAKRVGFQEVEVTGVTINIDQRRVQDFQLDASVQQLGPITIAGAEPPMIEKGVVGSTVTLTGSMIEALPVTSITEALSLQQGFQEIPLNTNVLSLAEEKRATTNPTTVRNARIGSHINVVDGVPTNNPFFGTPSINPSNFAVSQVQFSKGYIEPQYGNGVAGIVSNAIREGGERFEGGIDYQTTAIVGALGSRPDELQASHILRGYIAGPIPGTSNKFRYAVSTQVQSGRTTVLKFDNQTSRASNGNMAPPIGSDGSGSPLDLDLTPGWQAFGAQKNEQVAGKLTYLPSPQWKVSVAAITENRESLPYDRQFQLASGGDPWKRVDNLIDSLHTSGGCGTGLQGGCRLFQSVVQSSTNSVGQLLVAGLERRFERSMLQVKFGRNTFDRMTCSIWEAVCLENRFWRSGQIDGFSAPYVTPTEGYPYGGTDMYWGGDKYTSSSIRADLVSQTTDHHRIQMGASYLRSELLYQQTQAYDGFLGQVELYNNRYRANPIDISTYIQDVVEYDFLTINAGIRYDYGLAKGKGFTNPLIPSNETTARDACEGTLPGVPEFTYGDLRGLDACINSPRDQSGRPFLLDSATKLAQFDDFKEAPARVAFAPRIGLSFPLTEQAQVYFNLGRYTKNPGFHDVYRSTGAGTVSGTFAEGGDNVCAKNAVKPGTRECHQPMGFNLPDLIGNPNLDGEHSVSYEVGYSGIVGASGQYGISVSAWNRDDGGLTTVRATEPFQDPGATYNNNALPKFRTTVNQGYMSSRGLEIQFRRQPRSSFWGYDINYGWSRSTTSGPSSERAFELAENGDTTAARRRTEKVNGLSAGHVLNIVLIASFNQRNLPKTPAAKVLRNSTASITYRISSGVAYTPTTGTLGERGVRGDDYSARGPTRQNVDAIFNKRMQIGNAQYGFFVRVSNLLNIANCLQVESNTGGCRSGDAVVDGRTTGTPNGTSSTASDSPDFRSQSRRFFTGMTILF